MKARRAIRDGEQVQLHFPYHTALVRYVKSMSEVSFHPSRKVWTCSLESNKEDLQSLVSQFNFYANESLREYIGLNTSSRTRNVRASYALDADIYVDDLALDLFPFQRAVAGYMVGQKRAIMAEPMGAGKTPTSISAAHMIRAYPTIVVCPSSQKLNWAKEYYKWLPRIHGHISIISGMDPSDTGTVSFQLRGTNYSIPTNDYTKQVLILNYAILSIDCDYTGGVFTPGRVTRALDSVNAECLILDEAHAAKGESIRSYACEYLANSPEMCQLLTGSPVVNRPHDLIRLLQILGTLDSLGGYDYFTDRYCAHKYRDAAHLDELHFRLRDTCYIRHEKGVILSQLPGKSRSYVPVDISNWKDYRRVEERMREIRSNPNASEEQRMGALSRLRKTLAAGKVSASIQWIHDHIGQAEKLVVFAIHRNLQAALLNEFPDAARIVSGDTAEVRQQNVERFQNEESCRIIICALGSSLTSSPGAVGHNLHAASNVLICEPGFSPKHMEQAEDRCHRTGQNSHVNVYYLVAENTIDRDIYNTIEERRDSIDSATDGSIFLNKIID